MGTLAQQSRNFRSGKTAVLNIIDKSERRKPEQTLEDLEKIIGTRSEDILQRLRD